MRQVDRCDPSSLRAALLEGERSCSPGLAVMFTWPSQVTGGWMRFLASTSTRISLLPSTTIGRLLRAWGNIGTNTMASNRM